MDVWGLAKTSLQYIMEDVHLVYRNGGSYVCDCFAKLSLFGAGLGGKKSKSLRKKKTKQNKTPNRLRDWFVSYEQSLRKGFSETMCTMIFTH